MALLAVFSTNATPLLHLPSSSSQSTFAVTSSSACSFNRKSSGFLTHIFNGQAAHSPLLFKERIALICKASTEVDGPGPESPSEAEEEIVPVESLPLESKLQLKLEQKMRMKLAKKMRLKRKRLVMKRHLRKKGRWPPSKMKKHKNV